jgi:hypothetical protein
VWLSCLIAVYILVWSWYFLAQSPVVIPIFVDYHPFAVKALLLAVIALVAEQLMIPQNMII